MASRRAIREPRNSPAGTTRLAVEAVSIVHLSPAKPSIVLRALSGWTLISSLNAYALVWSRGVLSFSVQLRTEGQSLLPDTLAMSVDARMQLALKSLETHLSLYGVMIERVVKGEPRIEGDRVAAP